MDWFAALDNYCERLGPGFWGEPLNALSNASFIVAAVLLGQRWRDSARRTPGGLLLVALVLAIGIGSFLFHTFANRWSSLADVVPIAVFIHVYLAMALVAFAGLGRVAAVTVTLAFLLASPLAGRALAPLLGSSAFYGPALLAILAVAALSRRRDAAIARWLGATAAVFAVSIAFRAADLPLCEAMPQGTHARWHLLNGVVLYMLVRLYLSVSAAPARR